MTNRGDVVYLPEKSFGDRGVVLEAWKVTSLDSHLVPRGAVIRNLCAHVEFLESLQASLASDMSPRCLAVPQEPIVTTRRAASDVLVDEEDRLGD